MAARRPLARVAGKIRQLPSGDVLPQAVIEGLTAALAGKEPTISSGTSAQFWRGDKTWQSFGDATRAQTLEGLASPTNTAIAAADTVLAAFAKLQGQVTARMTNPMATAGDMIRGGTSGAPERVAAGTNGHVMTMVAGVPGWAAPAGGSDVWLSRAIGEPFPIWDHIAGVPAPPTDNEAYRYIKLTASDSYNAGVLISESVSGSAPEVQATAVINLAGSPMNGQTVRLINTEQRFVRAGTSGTVAADALQNITGQLGQSDTGVNIFSPAQTTGAFSPVAPVVNNLPTFQATTITGSNRATFDASRVARTANETRPKYVGATYYMRIR